MRSGLSPRESSTLDVYQLVTDFTYKTFVKRSEQGIAGSVAYLNGGMTLFDAFKRVQNKLPNTMNEAQFLKQRGQSVLHAIKGTKRAIIVGAGPVESLQNQELETLKHLDELEEVVLIDVSEQSLRDNFKAVTDFDQNLKIYTIRDDFRQSVLPSELPLRDYTTVISTGGLICNPENPITNAFPLDNIVRDMKHFANLAGAKKGNKLWVSYFSNGSQKSARDEYDKQELKDFFLNIPQTMKMFCEGLENFDPSPENFSCPEPTWNEKSQLIAHTLKIEKTQESAAIVLNGHKQVLNLKAGDEFVMMYSLRPDPSKISKIPPQNTGLTTDIYVSNGDIVEHVFNIKDLVPDIDLSHPQRRL